MAWAGLGRGGTDNERLTVQYVLYQIARYFAQLPSVQGVQTPSLHST